MISYLNSEKFRLDTMVHREGKQYVYMEAIPSNIRKDMWWLNGYLMNCKHIVKHVGTREQIADIIAKKLQIEKLDKGMTEYIGSPYFTDEYAELDYVLSVLPEVINADEVK